METSRKRFNSENDGKNKKRRSRKSKTKSSEEEIHQDECMEIQDEDDFLVTESDNVGLITLQLVQTCSQPYTKEDDIKIIKYFKANMNLLNMKDDLSIYYILKSKNTFQKSVKSLQSRFVNVILPNLFKYNVMNHADLIDFYDAAKLELPDEFIKILNEEEASNEKSKSSCVQKENINVPSTSKQSDSRTNVVGTSRQNNCNNGENTERINIPDFSRQSDSRTEVACIQSSTTEETNLKSILGFIQFSNSKGTCVFIPDTEPNIPSIKKRLLDEFAIQPESINILPKSRFDKMKQIKEQLDIYKKIMIDAFLNNTSGLVERMFPDAKELLKLIEERNRQPSQISNSETQINEVLTENELPAINTTASTNATNIFNATWSEIEVDNMGELIASLSDTLDHVTISPNIDHQKNNSANNNLDVIKTEPIDQDDTETVIASPYFSDHTYCKKNYKNITTTEVTSPSNNLGAIEYTKYLSENNAMDMESISPNTSFIETACLPQIVFSKRCTDKIVNENINIDHLLIDVSSKNKGTSKNDDCDRNKSNDNDTSETNSLNKK